MEYGRGQGITCSNGSEDVRVGRRKASKSLDKIDVWCNVVRLELRLGIEVQGFCPSEVQNWSEC